VIAAFATVYVVWGSTYLAIRYAVETLPPFLMAGIRFTLAGAILALWSYWRDGARATPANWRAAAIAGGFLLLGGNGMVVWAEQRVPSGLTALLVATMPLWMVIVAWAKPGGQAPKIGVAAGILLGIAGLALLVGPSSISGSSVDHVGAIVLTLAALSWAIGSLYSRTAPLPKNAIFATGLEMIAGGVLLVILGSLTGEWSRLDVSHASAASIAGFFYLVVFGSLIGFTAFAWLIRVSTPARVSTYAFVNPVVAVFLGWAIAHEPVTRMTVIATAVIVAAVALITLASASGKTEQTAAGD
jgi:drug/metabolite transporter (DMT)-like permease